MRVRAALPWAHKDLNVNAAFERCWQQRKKHAKVRPAVRVAVLIPSRACDCIGNLPLVKAFRAKLSLLVAQIQITSKLDFSLALDLSLRHIL